MKRLTRYAASGMRSTLFLTVLGCLLVSGLAGAVFQPTSATRFGAQPGAAPQNYPPQIQELRAARPAAEAQDHLRGAPLEGGAALELRDGQGAPAAVALRVRPGEDMRFEEVAQYDSAQRRFVPRPLDLGAATDQVFLVLYGGLIVFNVVLLQTVRAGNRWR